MIAFDTWVLKPRHRASGIYNYARSLLKELASSAGGNDVEICPFYTRGYSDEDLAGAWAERARPFHTGLLHYHRLWQLGGAMVAAARAHADLLFSPTSHTCPFGPVPVVTTLHDATPTVSPSYGSVTNLLEKIRLKNAAKFSTRCITDSHCSKKDLVEVYGIAPEKITVVHLGYDRATFNAAPVDAQRQAVVLARHGIRKPYVFHHGTVQPRKNLERLIAACGRVWEARQDAEFQLVLAGPRGWRYQPILAAAEKAGAGRVVFTGALPDEDLALLLKGAELCAVPSLYEGFCLPMVEAMACGVPTVASGSSCLPEVSGGALMYFDPYSIDAMAAAVRAGLEDSDLRSRLRAAGLARAAEFSWERCAKETLGVLRGALAEARPHLRTTLSARE